MTRPISLAALTILELTPPDMVSCAADAGFSHVGIRLIPATPTEPQYDLVGDTPLLREVERRLADTGVQVLDVEIFRLKPETDVAAYEPAIACAARLGARGLLVAANDPDEARVTDRFAAFCDLAATFGLTADLEFMPWTAVRDLSAAQEVVVASGSATAGILVDALHFDRAGVRPEELASVAPDRLHYVQFCDGAKPFDPSHAELIRIARSERLFPGMGGIDLVGLARTIPADVTISVEIPNHAWTQRIDAGGRAAMAREATLAVLRAATAEEMA